MIGIGPGDEVITTPLTCAATNIPLLRRGAKIVWADICKKTLCIDPIDVRAKVTEKTKAIVQVHLGGVRADVGIQHDIPIVSDAAQALGIFGMGNYTCCSFQAIKHITTGDGGMLVVDKPEDHKKAKLLRWFGIDRERKIPDTWQAYRDRMMTFDIEELGTKRHMNDIQAALGLAGLINYPEIHAHRKKIFDFYKSELSHLRGLRVVDGIENVYWLATLLVERRDDFARMLFEAGVETNLVQVRNDKYKVFGGVKADLPVMDEVEGMYISIPIGMHVSFAEAQYICSTIKKGW
jgi:dTDP-4-amino-4,6-dideoxygalactose transaminase